MKRRRPPIAVFRCALLLALSGCAAGPDYVSPPAAPGAGYAPLPAALPDAGGADARQHLQTGGDVVDEWWTLFRDPALDALLEQAVDGSPTLDTARATLAEAQEAVRVAQGALYPQADLGASAGRERVVEGLPGLAPAAIGNVFTVGPAVSYALDLPGGVRREIEHEAALADYQRDELAAAWLALTGNAVNTAIAAASAREQLRAVADVVAADRQNLELVRARRAAGTASRADLLSAQSQLAEDVALQPPLEQQLSAAHDALATLVGKTPAEWDAPRFDFDRLALPEQVPVALPSALLRARPDIRAADAQLHAASAAIGVATAQLYPDLALTASWTQSAGAPGPLFDSANSLWTLAATLSAPLFHGGALKAQQREAVAAFDAQLGVYRQTVLTAFAQVSDVLKALGHDAEELAAQRDALDAAGAALELTQDAYRVGTASLFDVLQSQRLYAQARLGYAKAKGQRYLDTAQLFEATGGAWQGWMARAAG